jgi:DNA polymerase delta subunit 1
MKKRDAGNAPGIGDRVAYVMVGGVKGSRNYENAEDPLFVLDNDIPIDFNYYIEKQIKLPLTRIFELILPNVNVLF